MRIIVSELAHHINVNRACELLAYPRSSYYRQQHPATPRPMAKTICNPPRRERYPRRNEKRYGKRSTANGLWTAPPGKSMGPYSMKKLISAR